MTLLGIPGVWSRDGRQIAFAKGSDIYLANADGANPRKVITVFGAPDWIRFSLAEPFKQCRQHLKWLFLELYPLSPLVQFPGMEIDLEGTETNNS